MLLKLIFSNVVFAIRVSYAEFTLTRTAHTCLHSAVLVKLEFKFLIKDFLTNDPTPYQDHPPSSTHVLSFF